VPRRTVLTLPFRLNFPGYLIIILLQSWAVVWLLAPPYERNLPAPLYLFFYELLLSLHAFLLLLYLFHEMLLALFVNLLELEPFECGALVGLNRGQMRPFQLKLLYIQGSLIPPR